MHELLEHCRVMMEHMSGAMTAGDLALWMQGMLPMGGAMGVAMGADLADRSPTAR